MYHYVKSVVLARTTGAQWQELDISSMMVYDIYNNFAKVFLELSNDYLPNNVFVDFSTMQLQYSSYQGTLDQLLVTNGNNTLETVAALPNSNIKYAKYGDAFQTGYKVDICSMAVSQDTVIPISDKVDLRMTRPNPATDMTLVHNYCLVSVNGFYHLTDTDGTYVFVKDGGTTMAKSKQNQLGILSFLDIGAVTKVPIKDTDITPLDANTPLYTRAYLNVGTDITNKTVLLVMGGYLVFPEDNVFWQNGDQSFALNLSALPLLERYFESNPYIDLSSLGLDISSVNPDTVNVPEFTSDAVIRKYLELSQSFFVVIDTNNIFTNKYAIRKANMPGMFTSFIDPVYPLVVNYGRVAEYWKIQEDGQWSVNVTDNFLRNFVFTYKPIKQLNDVTPNAVPSDTYKMSQGLLLEIGSYK